MKVGVRVRARVSRLGHEAHRGAVAVLQHVLVEQLDEDLVAAGRDLLLQPAEGVGEAERRDRVLAWLG